MRRDERSESGPRAARAARPRRRTQTERSAATREQVIQAVVDLIAEEGLGKATASRIASRAGVTWGAIAHQFGDKDSVLLAVLERSFDDLSASVAQAMARGARSPRERVSVLVDEIWTRLTTPSFRAFLEIVLDQRTRTDRAIRARQEDVIAGATRKIWTALFADLGVDAATIDTVRKLTSATLLGMAIVAMIGPRRPELRRELAVLKENVLHLLKLDAKAPGPARSAQS